MKKTQIPVRILYNQNDKPSVEFRAYFKGPALYATPKLWEAYKNWRRIRIRDDFALFAEDYTQNPAKAKSELDALPNPFANAAKGRPYRTAFIVPQSIYRFEIRDIKGTGLDWTYDPVTRECVISGTPQTAGEYKINLIAIWHTWQKGQPVIIKSWPFLINPDPADLWQNLPSDQTAEYARPDEEYAELACGKNRMFGASLRGRSHAHKALPRDDAFALGCANGWQILTVADGAGSAPFSRKGAELACQTVLAACQEKLAQAQDLEELLQAYSPDALSGEWLKAARKAAYNILPHAAFEAAKAIRAEAQARERLPRQYASTLLICIAKQFPGGWALLSFQIGDGAMAAFTKDGMQLLATPDEGEYGGQTRFITMQEIFEPHELMRRLKLQMLPDLAGVILMTDGVSDARFPSLDELNSQELWQPLRLELEKFSQSPDTEKEILSWLNFWSRGNHDDRTITWLITAD